MSVRTRHRLGRRLHRTLAGRLIRSDDTGASLIIALIMITVVALVTVSILLLSNTGVRTTVALRGQASVQYQASNAINSAIEKLRSAPPGADLGCTAGLLTVPYLATGTSPGGTVTVDCSVDTELTQSGFLTQQNAGPGTALLSLGRDTGDGITLILKKTDAHVNGGVFSNTYIDNQQSQSKANLVSDWERPSTPPDAPPGWHPQSWVIARHNYGTSNSCTDVQAENNNPPTKSGDQVEINCQFGDAADIRGLDPGTLVRGTSYNLSDPGSAARPPADVSACTLATSGIYKGAYVVAVGPRSGYSWATIPSNLSRQITNKQATCAGGGKSTPFMVVLNPATYYLDSIWTVPNAFILGGTPGALPAGENSMTDWITDYFAGKWLDADGNIPINRSPCKDPIDATASSSSGVEFFMAGSGAINLEVGSSSAYPKIVVCASLAAQGPPVLAYSTRTTNDTTGGAFLTGTGAPSVLVHLGGTIYTPSRPLNLSLNNDARSSFSYGLFAKSISVTTTGSFTAGGFTLAGGIPQGGGSAVPVNYQVLTAYVCPGQATCSDSGAAQLTAKVAITGYLNRSVSVISWSPAT